MNDWVKIYCSDQPYKCNIVKALLEEYNIAYRELNKKDSAYTMLGEIEIYVERESELFSQILLKQQNLE